MRVIIILLIVTLLAPQTFGINLFTNEKWDKNIVIEGSQAEPAIISPLLKIPEGTKKIVIIPEKIKLPDEIAEFRLFRNRYVLFGVYLFTSLYYNYLTRNRI